MSRCGLWVVDVQERLVSHIHESSQLLSSIQFASNVAQLLDIPLLVSEQVPERLGTTDARLSIPACGSYFKKHSFSGAKDLEILSFLEKSGISTWWLCGIETHICIALTAFGLQELGFNVGVLGDCVGARDLGRHQSGLQEMKQKGIQVSHSETWAYGLVESADHPAFKELLNLVKTRK